MRLTFLGTGTSVGIPMIGCDCAVCTSTDPHNRRLRTSALVEVDGLRLLIDAGPDLRQQALASRLARLDAVLCTHAHADHIAGLDDLRPLNFAQQAAIPLYGTAETLAQVRDRFSYAFNESSVGSSRPAIDLMEIAPGQPFVVGGQTIVPFPIQHGTWTITGFRMGRLGYVTDASALPPAALPYLHGLDVLVLNALGPDPHPTHFSISQALSVIESLRPRRALLVHMSHKVDHSATNQQLPPHVRLAYDGQVVEIADDPVPAS